MNLLLRWSKSRTALFRGYFSFNYSGVFYDNLSNVTDRLSQFLPQLRELKSQTNIVACSFLTHYGPLWATSSSNHQNIKQRCRLVFYSYESYELRGVWVKTLEFRVKTLQLVKFDKKVKLASAYLHQGRLFWLFSKRLTRKRLVFIKK